MRGAAHDAVGEEQLRDAVPDVQRVRRSVLGADTGKCLAKCTTAVAPALPACLDKCAYVVSPEHEMCEVKCYETAPCAPALCRDQPAAR